MRQMPSIRTIRRRDSFLRLLLSLTLIFFALAIGSTATAETLYLHQINIGCANAYLFIEGSNVFMVDCGTDTDVGPLASPEALFAYIEGSGIDHIDTFFITHYHKDHYLNVDALMERYGTDNTIVYGPSPAAFELFAPTTAEHYRQFSYGDETAIGSSSILCTGPKTVKEKGRRNADSLNLLISFGSNRILMTGDCYEPKSVKDFAEQLQDIDLLCFPHHGLGIEISKFTLKYLNPKYVFVPGSMAGNVRNFCQHHAWIQSEVYSTADGNLVAESDGESVQVHINVMPGEYGCYTGNSADS